MITLAELDNLWLVGEPKIPTVAVREKKVQQRPQVTENPSGDAVAWLIRL